MGCHPKIKACAPPATIPSRLKIIVMWWTESRCDSVCLRSRHFVAWHRPGLAQPFRPQPVPEPKKHQKPAEYHFLRFETAPHNHPTHRRRPTGGRARHSVRAAIGIHPPELSTVVAIQTLAEHLTLNTEHCPQTPVISLFYALKPHPTITQRITADPRVVGRVTPCAPLLPSNHRSFPQSSPSKFLLNTS